MSTLSCAKNFALAAILLHLVTSSALNVSPWLSSILPPSLPLSLRSFKSCLFSSSASRPVSFAAGVEMVLSFSDYFRVPEIGLVRNPFARVPSQDSVRHSRQLGQVVVLSHHGHLRLEPFSSSPCTATQVPSFHRMTRSRPRERRAL